MPRKKVASRPAPPPDIYPKVYDHYGKPWLGGRLANEPSIFNGIVSVERYQIRIERVDEPDDVVLARLKRLWRTSERNIHHWDPVRSYAMKRFGWDYGKVMAEFPSEENGIDYVPRSK